MQAIEDFLAGWAAAEQAGDTTPLERLLASDFTAVGPPGFILTRKRGWPGTATATSATRRSASAR